MIIILVIIIIITIVFILLVNAVGIIAVYLSIPLSRTEHLSPASGVPSLLGGSGLRRS